MLQKLDSRLVVYTSQKLNLSTSDKENPAVFNVIIPILFIDCRLPDSVIPAKAGIQALYVYYMQFFRQFLTVIGIICKLKPETCNK